MIQRIQTIFLLITAILMAVTVFSPLAVLGAENADSLSIFKSIGIISVEGTTTYPTWGVLFFAVLGALLPFANIFLYSNRKLQMKIGIATSLIIAAFYVAFYVYLNFLMTSNWNLLNVSYGIILPLIALVFNILAFFRIKKDEQLVQSLNRIR